MTTAARILVTLLVASAAVLLPTGASAAERTVTYTVSARGSVAGDLGHFSAIARETLADPRGWSLGGTLAFQQVPSGSDFDLILASPSVIAAASPGCSAQWSCRVGRSVYINDERWRFGTASWPHALVLYQRYVISHEVGHWLGLGHRDCPMPGRTAPVMQQQSISMQGCRANLWPVIAERAEAGRAMGVSVNWSAVERHYQALGQESSGLGAPVTWETIPPDGIGRFQHYSRNASIYWRPETGAHEVHGSIRALWAALGWELGLGYPVTGEVGTPDGVGRFNHFSRNASIYWTPQTGAHEVHGGIRARWASTGWERGPLGYPTSGEYDVDVGRRSDFQNGFITWHRATGQTEVTQR